MCVYADTSIVNMFVGLSLPCHCHAAAMPLPCRCHATAMPLPCRCMPLPCHRDATAMPEPCPQALPFAIYRRIQAHSVVYRLKP